jgi:hypothetical protein
MGMIASVFLGGTSIAAQPVVFGHDRPLKDYPVWPRAAIAGGERG